jgi:hypothetical protein
MLAPRPQPTVDRLSPTKNTFKRAEVGEGVANEEAASLDVLAAIGIFSGLCINGRPGT